MANQLYDAALDECLKALALAEESDSDQDRALALCAISEVDIQTYRDDQSWEHACQAEDYARKSNYYKGLAKALILKGRICSYAQISEEFDRNDEGISYLEESLSLSQEHGLLEEEAYSLIEMGQIYVNKNRWNDILDKNISDKADECFSKSELLVNELNDYRVKNRWIACAGRYFRQKGEYNKAIDLYENLRIDWPEDDFGSLFTFFDQLASLYSIVDNLESAFYCHQQTVYYMHQMENQRSAIALQEMETRYETTLKEEKISYQQIQIKRRLIAILLLSLLLGACMLLLHIIGYYRVQTKRKNVELAEANATKDALFAIISHDIKNPAIAQRNALRGLVETGSLLDSASLRSFHEELLSSAESEVSLVLNLLDWARVQSGKIKFAPSEFNLATVINEELKYHDKLLKAKSLTVSTDIFNGLFVHADRQLVAIVIRNIIVNAIKYSSTGGDIRIMADAEGEMIRCKVTDYGSGITADRIKAIFENGVKESIKGTAGEVGTGLGLQVCHAFVKLNGGSISVSSVNGEGTSVSFTLKKAVENNEGQA